MALKTVATFLSDADIKSHFDSYTAYKGQRYFENGRVVECKSVRAEDRYASELIIGKVQGTRRSPYLVEIALDPEGEGILYAECSCPLEGDCKHGAALLYEFINAGNKEKATVIQTVAKPVSSKPDTLRFSQGTQSGSQLPGTR